MAASERIFKLLDEPVPVESDPNAIPLDHPLGEIEFRNVWFSYNSVPEPADEDWVLRDVSFRVAPGQTFAIVGHTGAGKTTLISAASPLLRRSARTNPPRRQSTFATSNSRICAASSASSSRTPSSSPAPSNPISAWARPASTAPPSNTPFDEIGLGRFLRSLPKASPRDVNERGSTLSVGQRQLINFARALAHNPRFLILDEATSSVDTKTELLIREALGRLLTGRTAIVIAHRLSTIQHADRILVFHKGRLREQGAHQELLAQRGIYYRLYQLQYKEQELHLTADARTTPSPAELTTQPAPLPATD